MLFSSTVYNACFVCADIDSAKTRVLQNVCNACCVCVQTLTRRRRVSCRMYAMLVVCADIDSAKTRVLQNAEKALQAHEQHKQAFDRGQAAPPGGGEGSIPTVSSSDMERPQPSIFEGKLKCYQLKVCRSLPSLVNMLYNQWGHCDSVIVLGINLQANLYERCDCLGYELAG